MEQIIAKGRFHAAHRQLGYEGKCAWVHGHTWRGTFTVQAETFPRDHLDMSVDFGALKAIFRHLDHKMLVSEQDRTFLDGGIFEPEGVVVMPGSNPSVENVAYYCMDAAVDRLTELYPGHGIDYEIELTIQETDNNFFTVHRVVTI